MNSNILLIGNNVFIKEDIDISNKSSTKYVWASMSGEIIAGSSYTIEDIKAEFPTSKIVECNDFKDLIDEYYNRTAGRAY